MTSVTIGFSRIPDPVILRGNRKTAYRDPAAHYHDGLFRVYHTLCQQEDNRYYWYLAVTESSDLVRWTAPVILTPKDPQLNFSSPGNVVRHRDKWVLCLQTYPTPETHQTTGDKSARIWKMESADAVHWDDPQMMRVKGPNVPIEDMGRMIDPYLVRDKDDNEKWWCFYKQNGASMSYTYDLESWIYFGRVDAGENACVLVDNDEYVLIHSPSNGIGVKRSRDLIHWRDVDTLTLGQEGWPWAQGRLTAAHVLDLRHCPEIGRCVMFFHGSTKSELPETHGAASLAIAWSTDLVHWEWPG